MNLREIRAKYPQYDVLNDDELARALHEKFYPQLEFKDFSKRIGYLRGSNPGEYDPSSDEYRAKYGATSVGGGGQRFLEGAGKGFVDLARGAGQVVGAVSRDDVQASRERDAELMDSGYGKAGAITGTVAAALPAAFIPGANSLTGAALIGGGLGFLSPSTSTKETVFNTGLGAVAGPAAQLAGRGLAAGYRGAKALVEPFTRAGQERIAARTLTAFAGGKDAAEEAAKKIAANSQGVLPGVQPTTAELAENAGLAQLERTLKNNPEFSQMFADRAAANKGAILGSLDDIAGDATKRQAAVGAREAAASPLYKAAEVAETSTTPFAKIFERPSIQKAWARAANLAAEAGEKFPESAESAVKITGRQLHFLKMAMDDLADTPQAFGIGAHEARAIAGTRDALLKKIEEVIPGYKVARETYAQGSKPINQMDIGGALRDKLQPALADLGANTRLRPQAYAQALRDGDALAASTLGRNRASIADIMTPEQMQTLTQIGSQLGRRANADELGRAVGSNTGQNLVSQNVLRQFLGPLGLPETSLQRAAESTFLQSVMRPVGFAGKLGEQRALAKLAEAGLDPATAQRLLEMGFSADDVIGLLRYQGLLSPAAVSGANAAKQ